jgi:hypothetical protein
MEGVMGEEVYKGGSEHGVGDKLPDKPKAPGDSITKKELEEWRPTHSKLFDDNIRPFHDVRGFVNAGRYEGLDQWKRSKIKRARYLRMLKDPDFHMMKAKDQAAAVGVEYGTLKKYEMQVPDAYLAECLEEMREKHARQTIKVDKALFQAASDPEKDAKHKELWYRIHGWVPSESRNLSVKQEKIDGMSDAELLAEMIKSLPQDQKVEVIKSLTTEVESGPEGD